MMVRLHDEGLDSCRQMAFAYKAPRRVRKECANHVQMLYFNVYVSEHDQSPQPQLKALLFTTYQALIRRSHHQCQP